VSCQSEIGETKVSVAVGGHSGGECWRNGVAV